MDTNKIGDISQGEWISVHDERRPDIRCGILVSVRYIRHHENEDGTPCDEEGSEVAMGEYVPVCGHVLGYFDSFSSPHGDDWWITHWMPLPAPAAMQVTP